MDVYLDPPPQYIRAEPYPSPACADPVRQCVLSTAVNYKCTGITVGKGLFGIKIVCPLFVQHDCPSTCNYGEVWHT